MVRATRSSTESSSVTPRWNVPRSHARLLFERKGGDLVGRLRLEDRVAAGDKHDILLSLVDVGRWIGDRGRIDQRLPYHLSGFEIDRANPGVHRPRLRPIRRLLRWTDRPECPAGLAACNGHRSEGLS